MAVSKKKSNSSAFDSGASPTNSSSSSEKGEALEPLLELLIDLQVLEGRTSTSEPSENLSEYNLSEKQKKTSSNQSLESPRKTENSESRGFDVLFETVNPFVAKSSEETRANETLDKNQKSESLSGYKENEFTAENTDNLSDSDRQNRGEKKQGYFLSDSEDFDLISLQTLLEIPADAVDVSYSVAPVKPDKNENKVDENDKKIDEHETKPDWKAEKSSQAESQPDPEEIEKSWEALQSLMVDSTESNSDDSLEQLQNLIFGSTRSDFEQLKRQILESDLPEVRQLLEKISAQLQSLEYQIYEPEQLMQLIQPWIADILSYKVDESKEDVIQALKPIIDEIIIAKSRDNREKMSAAIADLIPEAIKHQIRNSPQEIAQAIGPEVGAAIREQIRLDRDEIIDALAPTMGKAIKEQVSLERDSMVDALYPVIGSTITRYLAEAIREINDKVANALSLEGVQRKIQAKIQGVSEAELILQQAIKSTVQAVFLIHKSSGLIISEVQQSGEARLESEMLAGMLTAIRSFVNDCIVRAEEIQELNEIEYGDSRILIEVAGYCYLAVILKGEIRTQFLHKIRKALIKITQKYGSIIEAFDGDPDTIPDEIRAELEKIMEVGTRQKTQYANQYPEILLAFAGVTVCTVAMTWGIAQHRSRVIHQVETQATRALDSEPELAIYRLGVDAQRDQITLEGKLPNQRLREKAETIVRQTVPNWTVDNDIVAVKVPPDPVSVEAEVQRMTEALNQMNGISISTQYKPDRVTIEGKVLRENDIEKVTQAFENIEGVNSVISGVQVEPVPIATRVYFNVNSPEFRAEDMIIKIYPVSQYLKRYPNLNVRIVGYSHPGEKGNKNSKLALKRSQAVQTALESYGIDRRRMTAIGKNERPPGVEENQPEWLSRAVIFEIISPEDRGN